MSLRLTSIEIEGFRGFADPVRLPLDGDAVVVTGSNGSGKTSLIDAICWGLSGRIDRLQTRRYRLNEELIVSRYRPGGEARVNLVLRGPAGDFEVERRGTSASSVVTVREGALRRDGVAATNRIAELIGSRPEDIPQQLGRSVLEQEELRAVLNAGPEELHAQLRELLGLGVLRTFEDAVDRLRKRRLDDLNAVAS